MINPDEAKMYLTQDKQCLEEEMLKKTVEQLDDLMGEIFCEDCTLKRICDLNESQGGEILCDLITMMHDEILGEN